MNLETRYCNYPSKKIVSVIRRRAKQTQLSLRQCEGESRRAILVVCGYVDFEADGRRIRANLERGALHSSHQIEDATVLQPDLVVEESAQLLRDLQDGACARSAASDQSW